MTILITLVLPPGGDAGPFNLFSNTDGYVTPFATNVSAAALLAGYTALLVPDGTTIIKVQSIGVCTNFVNVPVNVLPTTTTTSSSSTSTTSSTSSSSTSTTTSSSSSSTSTSTSTSTSSSTTTTTTTCPCVNFDVVIGPIDIAESIVDVQYVNCAGDTTTTSSDVVTTFSVCGQRGTIPLIYRETPPTSVVDSSVTITSNCCTSPTTTTTTSPPPAYYSYNVSLPGRESSGLACAEIEFGFTVYSDLYPLDFGHTVYTNTGLTAEVVGGNLWYLWGIEGTAYQIGNDGVITAFFNCP